MKQRGHQGYWGLGARMAWAVAALAALVVIARAEKVAELRPSGYVNDFAGVLGPEARTRLTELCQEVDQKTHSQISVVTIHSLEGVPIEDFSVNLAQKWGVGYKGNDRGVLILLAVNDHKYRFEVGYGLEPILPDGKVGSFGREMAPSLRAGDYSGALVLVTREIASTIAEDQHVSLGALSNESAPTESRQGRSAEEIAGLVLFAMVVAALLFGGLFFFSTPSVLTGRRRRGSWFGAGTFWGGGGLGGGWGGGGFGGGGGGFGGFGGGSFGGGGASGSW